MKSYNQLYDQIKTIVNSHAMVNTFGEGDQWEIATSGTINYPVFWVVTKGSTIRKGEIGYTFDFIVMDLVQTGEGNERDVLSDMHRVMAQVLADLKFSHIDDLDIKVDSFNLQSFTEKYDDMVAGWITEVTVWTTWNWNSCEIPTR